MDKKYWKTIFTAEAAIIFVMVLCILSKAGINISGNIVDVACAKELSFNDPCNNENNTIDNNISNEISKENKNIVVPTIQAAMFHQDEQEEIDNSSNLDNIKAVEEKYKDQIKKTFKTNITSYNSEAAQTDNSPCITASGLNVCERDTEDIVATNDLPLHTKILIPEYFGERIFYVEDRMNVRYTGTGRVDIWMKSKANSKKWGIKYTKIIVLKD